MSKNKKYINDKQKALNRHIYKCIEKDNIDFSDKIKEYIEQNLIIKSVLENKKNKKIEEENLAKEFTKLRRDDIILPNFKPNERVICHICEISYTRANKNKHYRSKNHLIKKNLKKNI